MDDGQNTVRRLTPICEALVRLLSPHAEVVLHNPVTDTVMAIWNPAPGRGPGDPSLLAELGDFENKESDVFGPYPKSLPDGRQLSSVSAVMRDDAGNPEAVLCINLDRTVFQEASRLLASFAAPLQQQPHELFEHDWVESVHELIGAYVRTSGTSIDRLTRADRRTLLAKLDANGVFGRQNSIPTVAQILHISRSSLYNTLGEIRKEGKSHR